MARRLAAMAASIPEPDEEVLEGQAPWTLEAELKGTLEIVVSDDLLPARKALASAVCGASRNDGAGPLSTTRPR